MIMPLEVREPDRVTLSEALSVLQDVKKVGSGYLARCPAHDDSTPSLTVHERGGKLLLHCHAGCDFMDIIAAIRDRLDKHYVAPAKIVKAPIPLVNKDDKKPWDRFQSVWEWWTTKTGIPRDFWESLGVTTYRSKIAFSFPDNVFKVRENASDAKYRWVHDNGQMTPPLWPDPVTTGLRNHMILAEGETDAATLRYIGLPAYGITKGANGVRALEQVLPALKRNGLKSAYIVYDCDQAGTKGAQDALKAFQANGIWARIVEPPLPYELAMRGGKDIQDIWHFVEHDVERFKEMMAQLLREPQIREKSWETITWRELMEKPIDQTDWIIRNVLRRGWLFMLAGHGKQGKTTLAFHMMNAIAHGRPFIEETRQASVVYLNYEMAEADVQQLLMDMSPTPTECEAHIVNSPPVPLKAQNLEDFLRDLRTEPGLVIVDCARAAFALKENQENDASVVAGVMRPLAEVARATNWAIGIIHHFHKGGTGDPLDMAGSSEWVNAADVIMTWVCHDQLKPGTLKLTGRIPPRDEILVELGRRDVTFIGNIRAMIDKEIERVLDESLPFYEDEAMTVGELFALLSPEVRNRVLSGSLKRQLYESLRKREEAGLVQHKGRGVKGSPFRYWLAKSPWEVLDD